MAAFTVSAARRSTRPFDRDHVFRRQQFRLGVHRRVAVGAKDQLRDAFAVAQVDEEHAAQIAAAMHPAHQDGAFAGVGGAKFAAGMRAAQLA